jgi:outer membrane protein assembly factor BamA
VLKNIIYIAFFTGPFTVTAQRYSVEWVTTNNVKTEKIKSKFQSREAAIPLINKTVNQLRAQGYWEASCDSVTVSDSITLKAYLFTGPLYTFGKIKTQDIPAEIKHESGMRSMNGKIAQTELIQRNIEKLLRWCDENGFPFASVKLDSAYILNHELNAQWLLEKGTLYHFDSVIVKGATRLPVAYIRNYIRIKPGDVYCESLLREVDKRIKEIPFLQLIKPSEIVFTQKQCMLYVYVKRKNASSFNGILGLLPDAITGKTLITGDARVSLRNAINAGETIEANWRRLGNQTQDMRLFAQIPFLFKSPIGTEGMLKIYKRDTSYVEVTRNAAIMYQLSPGNQFKLIYNRYTSDMISINGVVTQQNVLKFSDVTAHTYGLGFSSGKTDHVYNPRRGYRLQMEALAGHKNIRANAGINDSLYNDIVTRTEYYTGNFMSDYFIPLFRQSCIRIANQTRVIVNPLIFQNETMRLGGIRTIRGFDEESINTTAFTVFTAEYRFLFEENSFAYLFFDQAWYENNIKGSFVTDTPIGCGAGVSFGMKTGIFTLNYALGKQLGNPIQLRGSKVHFGFISYF